VTYPGSQGQFEVNSDRAREKTEEFTSLAEQADRERRAEAGATRRGPVMAFVDRVRSALSALLDR
jgi:hypothetical protein